jgi:hypothetical protein
MSRDLRLVCVDGTEGPRRDLPETTDEQGENELLDFLDELRDRLGMGGDLRYEVVCLIARFEQRLARRCPQ